MSVEINGIVQFHKTLFVGFIKNQGMVQKFDNMVNENYTKLQKLVNDGYITLAQKDLGSSSLCIYYSVDSSKEPYMATFMNAVEIIPSYNKEALFEIKEINFGFIVQHPKMLKLTYKGAYKNLGSAWQQGDQYNKDHGLVRDAGKLPFERYIVMGKDSSDENAVSEIYIPILNIE